MVKKITTTEVRHLAHYLAKTFMEWDEPIPEFDTRFPNKLESCLNQPFQTYAKKELYPTLVDKAAILFYLMVKNHPFENGNKRIAMTTLMTFLYMNKRWLRVDNNEMYNFAKWVAESNPKLMEETVLAIATFIKTYLKDL